MAREIAVEEIGQDLSEISRRLESSSLSSTMAEILPVIREGFAGNFSRAAGPTGTPWPPRKEIGDGHPLLNESGALLGATQGGAGGIANVGDRDLEIGVDKSVKEGGIPGAAVHNFGHPPFNIPKREFLYADESTLDKAAELLADGALEAAFVF